MILRTRATTVPTSKVLEATVRSDVVVLILALVALSGALVHNREDFAAGSFGILADAVPIVMFFGVAVLGFAPRARSAATWSLLITSWIMVVTSLVGLIPRTTMISLPADQPGHVWVHLLALLAQAPLIIMLIRRLNGAACRWTAAR